MLTRWIKCSLATSVNKRKKERSSKRWELWYKLYSSPHSIHFTIPIWLAQYDSDLCSYITLVSSHSSPPSLHLSPSTYLFIYLSLLLFTYLSVYFSVYPLPSPLTCSKWLPSPVFWHVSQNIDLMKKVLWAHEWVVLHKGVVRCHSEGGLCPQREAHLPVNLVHRYTTDTIANTENDLS